MGDEYELSPITSHLSPITFMNGPRKIRRALISVSDKTGIVEFAQELRRFGVEIISTGGTARALRESGIEVRDISDVTGFPEMMDGRVKTLHPRIHGGLLALRDNEEHMRAAHEHGIEPIDMVIVNLYPFEETVEREGVTLEEAIEQIDIGGPSMIRSAAKNFRDVAVLYHPNCYQKVLDELNLSGGALSFQTRKDLARNAFTFTGFYDISIYNYLTKQSSQDSHQASATDKIQSTIELNLKKSDSLRYGENPHQLAA